MDNGKFVYRKYKTGGAYGPQEILIPNNLMEIIGSWLDINSESEYFLIAKNKKTPLSENGISTIIRDQFKSFPKTKGKSVTLTTIRKLYTQEHDPITYNEILEQRNRSKVANDLSHSVLSHTRSYRKIFNVHRTA